MAGMAPPHQIRSTIRGAHASKRYTARTPTVFRRSCDPCLATYTYAYTYTAIMQRKLTITVTEEVYDGLHRVVGRGHISGFIEELVRPHVVVDEIEQSFRELAAYEAENGADKEALEWSEALIGDVADEPR